MKRTRLPILPVIAVTAVIAVIVASGAPARASEKELASLRTEHWIISYSTTEEMARQVGETLEKTRAVFIDTFARIGIELDEQTRLLECELYEDPASYTNHMKSIGRPGAPGSFGWYSPTTNRLTLIKPTISEAGGIKVTLEWAAAHEGAHQLAFDLGLLDRSRPLSYPPWFLEGVAGAFETNNPNDEFGPFSNYVTGKVQVIRKHVEQGNYAPLLELSDMPWPGSSSLKDRFENIPKERIQIYAQGASLAIYLITHRPEAFKAFLEELAGPSRSHTASSRWRAAFKDAFGDVDALESDWKRWLLALEPAS